MLAPRCLARPLLLAFERPTLICHLVVISQPSVFYRKHEGFWAGTAGDTGHCALGGFDPAFAGFFYIIFSLRNFVDSRRFSVYLQ
jgi:hypothetical protein